MKHLFLLLTFVFLCVIYSAQTSNDLKNQYVNKIINDDSYIAGVEKWVKDSSDDFHFRNLKEKSLLEQETEIRIWAALKYGSTRNCLILSKENDKWKARLYWIRKIGELGKDEKNRHGKIIVHNKFLSTPISGWKEFDDFLIEKQIRLPWTFSWEPPNKSDSGDVSAVTLEIKEGQKYSLISYGQLTESQDGKTILGVCSRIENEFMIKLGCRF